MNNLPKLQDLYSDVEIKKNQNDLNILLNADPAPAWLKKHPISKTFYIPIERVEWLLTKVFIRWNVEIKQVQLIANSVAVHVTLNYQDPTSLEWLKQDGLGASPLQTDAGAGANDWTKIKSSSVQMAAPAAETFAIKDAAEKIGKLFGKDINRADKIVYGTLSNVPMKILPEIDENNFTHAVNFLKAGKTIDELKKIRSFDATMQEKLILAATE